jgi:hypothetical protein
LGRSSSAPPRHTKVAWKRLDSITLGDLITAKVELLSPDLRRRQKVHHGSIGGEFALARVACGGIFDDIVNKKVGVEADVA